MKIAQIGGGNMGRIVAALARSKGHTMAIAIDSADGSLDAAKLSEKLKGADVVIDFSVARAIAKRAHRPLEYILAGGAAG